MKPFYSITGPDRPLVATAIHDGHTIRPELHPLLNLDDAQRLREEDPFTARWVDVAELQIVVDTSRFEVDLNRPREKAIYRRPEDAWGLHVWTEELPDGPTQASLAKYDQFYDDLQQRLQRLVDEFGSFVIYDLHTYNHLRDGADGPAADPHQNPEVNIGTVGMDRDRWAPVVDTFMYELAQHDFNGRHLDVRENVKFDGGNMMKWIHKTFPGVSCVMSIEFKKFFMNEWTGEAYPGQVEAIRAALAATVPGVLAAREAVSRDYHLV
ncbi:N-formylglutamate amidohydrolase [Catalinimonas alkaloidigena]|uniref:N-formylglutamate amidohydrolase n=1 Tax=Catalinimonas alkaloidigena TaxID=1075417 RepID=A0A1G9QBF5_9BACT|nr:N-formylglutamate amidohydrolase [Catalinimonas alkaloidigena]SDM08366.1 N-formylglutamate amidohydrolase [Catalinimonas alkaloidigena]